MKSILFLAMALVLTYLGPAFAGGETRKYGDYEQEANKAVQEQIKKTATEKVAEKKLEILRLRQKVKAAEKELAELLKKEVVLPRAVDETVFSVDVDVIEWDHYPY